MALTSPERSHEVEAAETPHEVTSAEPSDDERWEVIRGRIGGLVRDRAADDPELLAARRDLAAVKLLEHVQRVVDEAPALTPLQVDRIARVLRSATSPRPAGAQRGSGGRHA